MLSAWNRPRPARREPRLDLSQIPDDASRRKSETTREFIALLHLVDGAVRQWHHLTQLLPADRPPDRCFGSAAHDHLLGPTRSMQAIVTHGPKAFPSGVALWRVRG